MALQSSMQDIKAVTGMYDPNLGNRESSSQSGVAIRNLEHQGQVGNFHFQDNMSRSIKHLGRIIVQLIRKYYDSARVTRIIGIDESQKLVLVNGGPEDQMQPDQERHYDLQSGRYDVTISVGPSYTSKRQENLATLLDLQSKIPPEQAALISDLIASQIDAPIAEEIARRLKATLPPELQDKKPGQQQIPPQIQQQLKGLMTQHEALTAKVHELTDALEDQNKKLQADMAKSELDAQTRLEIARINQETELLKIKASVEGKPIDDRLLEIQDQQEQMAAIILQMAQGPAGFDQGGPSLAAGPPISQPPPDAGPTAGNVPPTPLSAGPAVGSAPPHPPPEQNAGPTVGMEA